MAEINIKSVMCSSAIRCCYNSAAVPDAGVYERERESRDFCFDQ